jgi:hypothetical protein
VTHKAPLAVLAVTAALTVTVAGTASGSAVGAETASPTSPQRATGLTDKGVVGTWTKVSTGSVAVSDQPSVVRTGNRELHVVYADGTGTVIRHSAIFSDGALDGRSEVLSTSWDEVVPDPVVVSGGGDNLRVLFGGMSGDSGYYGSGRMYGASSSDGGTAWSLDAVAAGKSVQAHAQDGTAATTLSDHTPVAGFALGKQLVWHVGESNASPDQSYLAGADVVSVSHPTFVRSGGDVWAGWLQQGTTTETTGFFAMRIHPTVGTPAKAPGSSVGSQTVAWQTRTPLAARVGGGVFEAYCVGAPTCRKVRIWHVGTTETADIRYSRYATTIAISPGPQGRLWVAWANRLPQVRAVRTNETGLTVGGVQKAGIPRGGAAYSLAIDGTIGRGDLVLNAGDALWHTQVFAGLTVTASPTRWRHGTRKRVVFTVSDAGDLVRGARVAVDDAACTTGSTGTCTIRFPRSFPHGRHTARATKSGYGAGAVRLRVR